jgi:ribosomal-protein-alanine N-acetyltransferase
MADQPHIQAGPAGGIWTSASSPRHSLHAAPVAVFEAMVAGNVAEAERLAPPSLPPLTPFIATFAWQRQLGVLDADPGHAAWMPLFIVYDAPPPPAVDAAAAEHGPVIVGFMGFHHRPDARGAVEVGYMVDPEHRRQGHAKTALRIVAETFWDMPEVKVLKGDISVDGNAVSERMLLGQGLRHVGQETKERGGLMDVYEMDVSRSPAV